MFKYSINFTWSPPDRTYPILLDCGFWVCNFMAETYILKLTPFQFANGSLILLSWCHPSAKCDRVWKSSLNNIDILNSSTDSSRSSKKLSGLLVERCIWNEEATDITEYDSEWVYLDGHLRARGANEQMGNIGPYRINTGNGGTSSQWYSRR